MNNASQLSIIRMIEADYIAFVAVLAPFMLLAVYAFSLVTGREVSITYTYTLAVLSIAGIIAVIWRYRLFSSIFEDGQQAQATITGISFYRDRGKIAYEYTYMGQMHKSSSMVHKIKRTVQLQVDDHVVVMIDRNKPNRAFIRDLYCSAEV
jgi:hypothetical protein